MLASTKTLIRQKIFKRRLWWWLAGSILIVLAISAISAKAVLLIRDSSNRVITIQGENLLHAKDLLALFEARSANGRAFLLTGREEFFQNYEREREEFESTLKKLQVQATDLASQGLLIAITRRNEAFENVAKPILELKRIGGTTLLVLDQFASLGIPKRVRLREDLDLFMEHQRGLWMGGRRAAVQTANRILLLIAVLMISLTLVATALWAGISKTLAGLYRKSEDALEKQKSSEALMGEIIDSAMDCVISMDRNGKIIEFNPAAEAVFGYSREEVLGKELVEIIIPPAFRDAHRKGLRTYLATGEGPILDKRLELKGIRRGWEEFPVELTITRTRGGDDPLFTGFLRDITERKKIEDQRIQAVRARDELVAVVSHELKNPLTAMATGIELIKRTRDGNQEAKVLERQLGSMQSSILRMTRLTSDLLDVTKIESGRLSIEMGEWDTGQIVSEVLMSLEPLALEKNIRIRRHFSPGNLVLPCDRQRIMQVVSNVVGNALKFTHEGGVVDVSVSDEGEKVSFIVTDNGPGISADELPHIFDRFWQAKDKAFMGTGLGLSIVKGIVEAHGGRIWARSEQKQGTSFYFTLPRLAVEAAS
jgi:PAS domain S-box-containing protein